MSAGAQLVVEPFAEIVRPDGGELRLVAVQGDLLPVASRPGVNEQCETCVMGPEEFVEMLRSAVADHDPAIKRVAGENAS